MTAEDDELSISERETQFVPQEDDEETLWEVIEITSERADKYRVKWAGLDPQTQKPWSQSWVPKRDCTDELVRKWKFKQARKRKKEGDERNALRDSNSVASRDSRSSMSKRSDKSRSTTTTTTSTTRPAPPSTSRAVDHGGLKRKHEGADQSSSEDLPDIHITRPAPNSRPEKKRKVRAHNAMTGPETSKKNGKAREVEPSSVKKGKRRKVVSSSDEEAPVENSGSPMAASQPKANPRKKGVTTTHVTTPDLQPQPAMGSKDTRRHAHGSTSRDPSSQTREKETSAPCSADLFGSDLVKPGDPPPSPRLSSPAKQRLQQFDLDLKEIEGAPGPPRITKESSRHAIIPETQTSQSQTPIPSASQPRMAREISKPPSGGDIQQQNSPAGPPVPPPTLTPHLPVSSIQTYTESDANDGNQAMSSIKQFSSPAKAPARNRHLHNGTVDLAKQHKRAPSADVLVPRTEDTRHQRIKRNERDRGPPKRTLTDILRVAGSATPGGQQLIKPSQPSSKVKPRSPLDHIEFPTPAEIVREMEDTYLDLHRDEPHNGAGSDILPPWKPDLSLLREEEEESSQDILSSLEQEGQAPRPESVALNAAADDVVRSPNIDESSLQPLPPGSSLVAQAHDTATSQDLPLSQPPDEDSLDYTHLPPTASTRPNTPSQVPQDPQSSQEKRHHLSAAMTLLNAKSDEIAKLDNLLSQERKKSGDSIQQLEAMEASKTAWETERSALAASLQTALGGKASAEKDREFFREQYGRASGFVTSVREENVELEERVALAETRARDGVAMVKATFEQRIKALEDDLKLWKQLSTFLMSKDKRTDDEVRRRAAEEPELRARCANLEEQCDDLAVQMAVQEEALEKKDDELEVARAKAETDGREVEDLRKRLDEANAELGRIRDEQQPSQEHDGELVYRCLWRGRDKPPCEDVFLTLPDLEGHMYISGHLRD